MPSTFQPSTWWTGQNWFWQTTFRRETDKAVLSPNVDDFVWKLERV